MIVSYTEPCSSYGPASVRPSVRLSVCHASVFYQNDVSKDREIFTAGSRNDSVLRTVKIVPKLERVLADLRFIERGAWGKLAISTCSRISEMVRDGTMLIGSRIRALDWCQNQRFY